MIKEKQSTLEWTSKFLDALDARVKETGQSSEYSNRIEESHNKLRKVVLNLTGPKFEKSPQSESTRFREMVGGIQEKTEKSFVQKEANKTLVPQSTDLSK